MEKATPAATATPLSGLDADWFDPLEDAVRGQVRVFIEQLLEEELEAALGRGRYERGPASTGHRNGHRDRRLDTTFGPLVLAVPRARLADDDAGEREWRSKLLPAYQRLSRRAELLIAQVYLAGVNTRRVRRALQTLFAGRIGKDAVSRAWRKTRAAWEAWQQRDLTDQDIVRLILDGTVVKVRLDRRATAISLLIVLGIRRDGQKIVLAIRNMGGESEAAWRAVLDDLLARGLAKPELVIVDGGKGLEAALASLWQDIPVQRCTVGLLKKLGLDGAGFDAGVTSLSQRTGSPSAGREEPGRRPGGCDPRPEGEKERQKSGREPLQVDRGGGQEGLDAHVLEPAPHRAGEPVPGLGLPMETFRPPAVALVETRVLR
jgi:hypothetical protein